MQCLLYCISLDLVRYAAKVRNEPILLKNFDIWVFKIIVKNTLFANTL